MEYNHYQLNDFLQDDSFVDWTLFGDPHSRWPAFLAQYPQKQSLVDEAQTLIRAIYQAESEPTPSVDQQRVWAAIQRQTEQDNRYPKNRSTTRLTQYGIAVLIVLIGSLTVYLWQNRAARQTISYTDLLQAAGKKGLLVEAVNEGDESRSITLADGTTVRLSPGSRVSYPAHFAGNKREIVLNGEAFFQVVKDPNRPFYVYANELVTKVLGTSFRVNAFDRGKQVIVEVKTGKVSVFRQNRIDVDDPETQGLILLPNQQAVLQRESEGLNRTLVEEPLPVRADPQSKRVKFDDASAVRILNELEALYEVEIRYNEDVLADCYLSTTITGESLYSQLDIICQTIGATYKVVDAQIIIESKGCK